MVSVGYLFFLLIIQSTFTPKKGRYFVPKWPIWGQKGRLFAPFARIVSGLLTNADLRRTPAAEAPALDLGTGNGLVKAVPALPSA